MAGRVRSILENELDKIVHIQYIYFIILIFIHGFKIWFRLLEVVKRKWILHKVVVGIY